MVLITDRTEADALLGNEKGKYRYTDLNRVEQAVAELCALAPHIDCYPKLSTKTDWGAPGVYSVHSWPTDEQMQRYLQNVTALCDLFSVEAGDVPQSPDYLDWQGANAIEKALQDVYLRVISIINSFRYSGEIFAGEENVL